LTTGSVMFCEPGWNTQPSRKTALSFRAMHRFSMARRFPAQSAFHCRSSLNTAALPVPARCSWCISCSIFSCSWVSAHRSFHVSSSGRYGGCWRQPGESNRAIWTAACRCTALASLPSLPNHSTAWPEPCARNGMKRKVTSRPCNKSMPSLRRPAKKRSARRKWLPSACLPPARPTR